MQVAARFSCWTPRCSKRCRKCPATVSGRVLLDGSVIQKRDTWCCTPGSPATSSCSVADAAGASAPLPQTPVMVLPGAPRRGFRRPWPNFFLDSVAAGCVCRGVIDFTEKAKAPELFQNSLTCRNREKSTEGAFIELYSHNADCRKVVELFRRTKCALTCALVSGMSLRVGIRTG